MLPHVELYSRFFYITFHKSPSFLHHGNLLLSDWLGEIFHHSVRVSVFLLDPLSKFGHLLSYRRPDVWGLKGWFPLVWQSMWS